MPIATSVLRKEHDAILKMLDATEQAARRIESGQTVAPETLQGLLATARSNSMSKSP